MESRVQRLKFAWKVFMIANFGIGDFKPLQRQVPADGDVTYVCDLIAEGRWDVEHLQTIFSHWEVDAIYDIVLPLSNTDDGWTWNASKSGTFSVKSAYFLGVQEQYAGGSMEPSPLWKNLWDVCVPPKVRNFGWKVLNNALPVGVELAIRGMEVDVTCMRCGRGAETVFHMLLNCEKSSQMWHMYPLRLDTSTMDVLTCKEWMNYLMGIFKEEWWSLFWAIGWSVWLCRNAWYFEKEMNLMESIMKGVSVVGEYEKALKLVKVSIPSDPCAEVWVAPTLGLFKINTDAAMFERVIGCTAVARDHVG